MKTIGSIFAAALLAASISSTAKTVEVDVTVSNLPHDIFAGYSIDTLIGSYYDGADWPSFTASLSQADTLKFVLSAPAGYTFQYTPTKYSIGMNLFIGATQWSAPGATGNARTLVPISVNLDNFTGSAPNGNNVILKTSTNGKIIYLDGYLSWYPVQEFSFTGFTVTADLTGLHSLSLPEYTYTPNAFGARFQDVYSSGVNFDPGPSLKLVAVVPEPGTYALMFLGLLAVGGRLRGKRLKNALVRR